MKIPTVSVAASAAIALSILVFPAQGGVLSFTTLPTVTTSTNITGSGTTPLVFGPNTWQTTNDDVGCVVFPGTAPANVCGRARFAGTGFISNPGVLPNLGLGEQNYVFMDGSPGSGTNSNTDTLYYSVNGLTPGQAYVVTFDQAAAQLVASGQGPTTEQWLVSLDTGYVSSSPTAGSSGAAPLGICDPSVVQLITGITGNTCESHQAASMSAPGCPTLSCGAGSPTTNDFNPWELESLTFTASAPTELLGFFAEGGPGGAPPTDLLGNVTINPAGGTAPEPATYMLMGIGLAGMLAVRRHLTKRR